MINKLLNYINVKKIILITIFTFLMTIISILSPYIIAYIIDNMDEKIINFIILLFVLYLMKFILNIIVNKLIINESNNIIYNLRKDLFSKLEKLPISYFDKEDKGNIISTLTNDIDAINDSLEEVITSITTNIITFIGVTIIMFYMNVILSIIVIITVPLFFFIISKMSKKMTEYFDLKQQLLGDLTSSTEELVSNVKTIKSLNNEKYFIDKFNTINNKYKNISIKSSIYSYLVLPINIILNNFTNILIILVGSIMVVNGHLKIGGIIAFLSYSSMFKEPINDIATLSSTIGEAISGLKRIFKIIDFEIDNKKLDITDIKGNIEFNDLYFRYDKKYVLKDINLKIVENEVIAIVGETGSGKTTIANVLEKFYKIDKGNIIIDNKNINDIDTKFLRKNIGIVLQDTYVFKGTVFDNIKYGTNISDSEVIKICKKLNVDKFINRLKDGYNTIIEVEGSNLSVGEKQIIGIVRCLIKNPKIVILDEATSSVDIKTEKDIYNCIQKLLKNRTCIIIAHRLSTIVNADKIIVLDNGECVGMGTHKELLKNCEVYKQIALSQLKEEEL